MQRDEQSQTEEEDSHRDQEVAVGQSCADLSGGYHGCFEVCSILSEADYFRELISITKRYFTSCFSMRSKASLIFWIGMTSTSAVMFFSPQ